MNKMEEHKEYIGIISDENKPNIISNDLDQAPKTWEQYEERLDWMKNEIAKAMDWFFSIEETEEGKRYFEWLEKNQNLLPLWDIIKKVSENPGKRFSYQLKIEKIEDKGLWLRATSGPKCWFNSDVELWDIIIKIGDHSIKEWEISTYITFEWTESWNIKIKSQQIQIAPKGSLLPKYARLSHKILTPDEFLAALELKHEEVEWENSVENKPVEINNKAIFNNFRRKSK